MFTRLVIAVLNLAAAAPPAGQPAANGLDPVPFIAEAIGLKMSVPDGAISTTQSTDAGPVYFLTDGGATPSWSMRLSMLTPLEPDPSAAGLIAGHLNAVTSTGRPSEIIARGPMKIGDAEAEMLYLRQTTDDGQTIVSGWLVLPSSETSFLVLSLLATADRFGALRPVLDACLASIQLRTVDKLRRQRQEQIALGRAFVASLTEARLRSLPGPRRWYRIYKPGGTGRSADDNEVGFMSLQCLEGARGALTPERAPDSYSALEAEPGLVVVVEARAIVNAERQTYVDVEGRYWLAWDRSDEAWSVRQTQRQADAARTAAETGVRTLATLDVIHSSREELTRDPTRWSIPDTAYLSQPELFLLGSLLPRDGSAEGDMALYCYDSGSKQLTQRIDEWRPAADGSGQWILTTQVLAKPGAITQRFDASGDRINRIDADGTVTERIDPAELQRLWKAKGLVK